MAESGSPISDDGALDLHDLLERIIARCPENFTWAESREALWRRLIAAAESGALRMRHPDTLLPERFADWPTPSSSCLVCTVKDVDDWLASEGVPYGISQCLPAAAIPRVPLMVANVERVRRALRAAGFNETALPPVQRGRPCPAKAAARAGAGLTDPSFDHAWQALEKTRRSG